MNAGASGVGLVLPPDQAKSSAGVDAAYSRYLVSSCRRFFSIENDLPEALRGGYGRVANVVREALELHRGKLLACFASPAIGTVLQCAGLREQLDAFRDRIDEAVAALLPHLLFEMSLRDLIAPGSSVLWEHGAPRLASLAVGGELVAPASSTGLRFSSSHVAALDGDRELARIEAKPAAIAALGDATADRFGFSRCYWPVGGVTCMATVDRNPIAEFEEHPEKAGNHIDLGGRSAADWVEMLDDCFALVGRYLPGELGEMRRLLHQAVPVGYDDHRHLSASYREAVGTMYLTLHPSVMIMTEAVIHEFQHNKLNAAAYADDFLHNAFHPRYPSPVRPDPRPLWGILLAVHAFLPVAELYRRMRDDGHPLAQHPDFDRRMSDIDLKNHEGMEMLRAHAEWTPAGADLFAELSGWEERHLAERAARGLDNTPDSVHLG